jgi:hypothetical protein
MDDANCQIKNRLYAIFLILFFFILLVIIIQDRRFGNIINIIVYDWTIYAYLLLAINK